MELTEIKSRAKKIIARVLQVEESSLGDETNFIFDLGANSQQSLELVAAFEEEFGVEMEMEKAVEVQNVSGAVEFIAGCIRSQS